MLSTSSLSSPPTSPRLTAPCHLGISANLHHTLYPQEGVEVRCSALLISCWTDRSCTVWIFVVVQGDGSRSTRWENCSIRGFLYDSRAMRWTTFWCKRCWVLLLNCLSAILAMERNWLNPEQVRMHAYCIWSIEVGLLSLCCVPLSTLVALF